MKVEIYKLKSEQESNQKRGSFFLFYGKSGVGKSATALKTALDPIFYLLAERGNVDLTIAAINRPDIKLATGYYESWDDLLAIIYNVGYFLKLKIKSLIFDSLTHVMNIRLSDEILEQNFDAQDKKTDKDLTMRVKMSQEGFGTLSKQMVRLMMGFEQLTIAGIDVICLAREDDKPKWNRDLSAAPALAGREFPRDMKGFFDFIGLVESRFNAEGEIIYPPAVSFDDDGSYISKWTGIKPVGGVIKKPMDIQKILSIAHGIK